MAMVFSHRSFSQAGDSCRTPRGEQRIGYERCLGDPAFVAVDTYSDYIRASFGLDGSVHVGYSVGKLKSHLVTTNPSTGGRLLFVAITPRFSEWVKSLYLKTECHNPQWTN